MIRIAFGLCIVICAGGTVELNILTLYEATIAGAAGLAFMFWPVIDGTIDKSGDLLND